MKSCVLLLILLVPTAATFAKVDQWHVQKFSAAGCKAADKVEDDYKELGVCKQDDANTWEKAVENATHYTRTKYSESTCTTQKTPVDQKFLSADCTEKDSKWQTGSKVTTFDTFRGSGPYSDNTCTTLVAGEFGPNYHAMNTCQQTSASTSSKYVCTSTTIKPSMYKTKDCSGAIDTTCGGSAKNCLTWTSGDVCSGYHAGHEHAGKFYKYNCGPITSASESASEAWRPNAYGLAQLLSGTALAALMSL